MTAALESTVYQRFEVVEGLKKEELKDY